jgi:hypothetical protein
MLEFRWDWENDGIYDTSWTHNRSGSHQYSLESWQSMVMFYPKLQVRDGLGAMDTVTQEVLVRNSLLKDEFFNYMPLVTK